MRAVRRSTTSRLWLVGTALIAAAAYLSYRLYELQVIDQPILAEKAQRQRLGTFEPDRPRLSVVDRNDAVLAVDEPVYDLYVHPFLLDRQAEILATRTLRSRKSGEPAIEKAQLTAQNRTVLREQLAHTLAETIGRPVEPLAKLLARQSRTVQIARGLSEGTHSRIRALDLIGLEFNTRHRRVYPEKTNSAALVGFVNYDGEGQAGIEQYYQKRLLLDSPGFRLPLGILGSPTPAALPGAWLADPAGERAVLTIDARLQRAARLALEKGVLANRVSRGTAIVLEPKTGEILALVVAPTFDNNRFAEYPPANFKNWAVSDLYEPGSTFKPINVAIGLTAKAFSPEAVVFDSGSLRFGKYTISNYDHKGRGALSVTRVLMYSDNIGMIKLMQHMKPGFYYDRLIELGLTRKSGIDLPGETRGLLPGREQFSRYPVQSATVAFGQGVALTPLQLARLHGAIANGGILLQPRIVRALVDADGRTVWLPEHREPKRIFSEEASAAVREMMMHVVAEGTGKPAQIPGYRLGGKTGTAQKANIGGHGYLVGKKITSFVAYLPARDPKYVVLVVLDEPKSENAFGSTTAAPIAREICQELIAYAQIPPSHPEEIVVKPATQPPKKP